MTNDEFIAALDRYGSDVSLWPSELRLAAEALLQQGPGDAWKQYRIAQNIDAALNRPVPPAGRALLERILLAAQQPLPAAQQPLPERFSLFELFSVWQRRVMAGAVCASLIGGVVVGMTVPPAQTQTSVQAVTASVATSVAAPATGDDIFDDVPGLTWSPGEVGGLL